MKLEISLNQQDQYSVSQMNADIFLNEKNVRYEIRKSGPDEYILFKDLKTYVVKVVEQTGHRLTLNVNGDSIEVTLKDHIMQILEKLGMDMTTEERIEGINAPMPGTILEITVTKGDSVKKGDRLLILEAMKMENVIKAPVDGVVNDILVKAGQNVEKNQPLLSF